MKALNEAVRILRDDSKRRRYDMKISQSQHGQSYDEDGMYEDSEEEWES